MSDWGIESHIEHSKLQQSISGRGASLFRNSEINSTIALQKSEK
jgi:hypothetical protein